MGPVSVMMPLLHLHVGQVVICQVEPQHCKICSKVEAIVGDAKGLWYSVLHNNAIGEA